MHHTHQHPKGPPHSLYVIQSICGLDLPCDVLTTHDLSGSGTMCVVYFFKSSKIMMSPSNLLNEGCHLLDSGPLARLVVVWCFVGGGAYAWMGQRLSPQKEGYIAPNVCIARRVFCH